MQSVGFASGVLERCPGGHDGFRSLLVIPLTPFMCLLPHISLPEGKRPDELSM